MPRSKKSPDEPKKKMGRPRKNPDQLAPRKTHNRQTHDAAKPLAKAMEKKEIADYVLSGMRPSEVATKLGISTTLVYNSMKEMENELSSETQMVAERLRYINIARIERMMGVHFLRAVDGDQRAAELVGKLIKLEDDLVSKTEPKTDDPNKSAINIENIELTITTSNPMFQIAQANMQEDWLGLIDTPLEMLYEDQTTIPEISDRVGERISEIEQIYGDGFVERQSTDDDE